MSTATCMRCTVGQIWAMSGPGGKVECDYCHSMWLSWRDYVNEVDGKKSDSLWIEKELPAELEALVQMVRVQTMREVGGHLMNVFEKTDAKYRAHNNRDIAGLKRLEGETGALFSIMEWLGDWDDKIEGKVEDDDASSS